MMLMMTKLRWSPVKADGAGRQQNDHQRIVEAGQQLQDQRALAVNLETIGTKAFETLPGFGFRETLGTGVQLLTEGARGEIPKGSG